MREVIKSNTLLPVRLWRHYMPKKSTSSQKKKLQIALYWAASCGGCEIAVLDINEKILDVVDPIGTFYKYSLPHSIIKRRVMK